MERKGRGSERRVGLQIRVLICEHAADRYAACFGGGLRFLAGDLEKPVAASSTPDRKPTFFVARILSTHPGIMEPVVQSSFGLLWGNGATP